MLCARCGAANAETAFVCGKCGVALKNQSDTPMVMNAPGQPFAQDGRDATARPIDEMPTAHVPSVSGASGYVSASQVPHSQEFPLELGQAFAPSAQAGEGMPASQTAFVAPPVMPSASQSAHSMQPSSPDIADYPTRTSVPIPPVSNPALVPEGQERSGREVGSPGLSAASNAQFARPGMLSLPARPKKDIPPSQPGLNTPAGPATPPAQPSQNTPPSQPGAMSPLPANLPPASAGMSRPSAPPGAYAVPTQAGMNTPLPEMVAPPSSPPGMYAASGQVGISRPPSQPGIMGGPPPQTGGPWQGWRGEDRVQTAPAPERLGNVYPGSPGQSPAQGPASQGGSLSSAGQSPAEELNRLARPLPHWAALGGPAVAVLLLLGLVFVNPDWATGAMVAGMVAIILVILLAIATGVRIALGMLRETNPQRRVQIVSVILLGVLLLLLSGVGVSQQNNLHLVQGRYLENQQSWAAAISQYQSAGEKSSAAVDVARVYNEWGEAQDRKQQYSGAVTSFSMVIQNYQQATSEFSRAKTEIVTSYLNWAAQASQQQDYAGATAHYDALLTLVFCIADSNCIQPAQAKDATAYYNLAEQQLARQQYAQAVAAYQTLQTRFPKAPEVSQIHAHYAQALWGNGQQQMNTSCPDALATYRLLAKLFADTSEGRQAATLLAKPVQVKGHFTQSVPGAPYHPTAFLVQGLVVGIQQYQFPPLLAHAPTATIQSDGSFLFSSVPQGTYELVWSSDNTLHFYYAYSGKHILYVAHLGQLCAFDYGPVNQAIPTK